MRRLVVVLAITLASAPVARAAPVACPADCTVLASEAGYLPPVMPLADGDTVAFRSLDIGHPTTDSLNSTRCFSLPVDAGGDERVRLVIAGGQLRATTSPGTPSATTKTCATATALADGGFVLPFLCMAHPQMRGAFVVQA